MKDEPLDGFIGFLYGNGIGRTILRHFVVSRGFSKACGILLRSKLTKPLVKSYATYHEINMRDCPDVSTYDSLAELFARPRDADYKMPDTGIVIAPSDGAVRTYKVDDFLATIDVKGSKYTVSGMLGKYVKDTFSGGYAFVIRLGVNDWHHFVYCTNGHVLDQYVVDGELNSVRDVAGKSYPYSKNLRHVCIIYDTQPVAQIEVGALLVGDIRQDDTTQHDVSTGEHKGNFELGGSSIVVFVKDCYLTDVTEKALTREVRVEIGDILCFLG